MTNSCTDPGCPCEGAPTLALLYAFRAKMGLVVENGAWPVAEYDRLQAAVRSHEQAMGSSVWRWPGRGGR